MRDLRAIAVPAYAPMTLSCLGLGAVLPVIPLTARALGAPVSVAAFMVALLGIGTLVGDLPAGALASRLGERTALLLGCGLEAAGMLVCVFARETWQLALGVLVLGLSGSVFALARQVFLTEAVPVHLRARALSTLGGVGRIGLFVGPFVGAAAVSAWGIGAAYVVGVVASLLSFPLLLLVPDITAHRRADAASAPGPRLTMAAVLAAHRRTLLTLGLGAMFISIARASRMALVPLWAEAIGLDAAQTSLVFGIAGAVDMLLFYPAGGVMDRYGRMWVAIPSMVVLGVGMMLLPLTGSFGSLTAVAVLLGFGNGIGAGLVMTLGADASPDDGRTLFLGGWRLMSDVGGAGGPGLVSALTLVAPLGAAAVAMGMVALVGAGWLRVWVPRFDPVRRAAGAAPSRRTGSSST